MGKEMEWKRTLACKLFEERRSVDGVEGMDYLWEIYEIASNRKGSDTNKKKKHGIEYFEEEEEKRNVELCCLQDLNLSAGEKILGVGKSSSNLARFSKALKGIGWLHHVTSHPNKRTTLR
ncbi:hypothetical protein LguiB_030844 [Lonicera macranthoides]